MSFRLFTVCCTAAGAFLATILAGAMAGTPCEPVSPKAKAPAEERTLVRVYQVADLVVPLDNVPGADIVQARCEIEAADKAGLTQSKDESVSKGRVCVAASGSPCSGGKTNEDRLIKLICRTVQPESWSEKGGRGTIDYFPLGMALVVNQTPEIHEQVEGLLAALRRLQDMDVAVELRFITVSEATYQKICKDFGISQGPCPKTATADLFSAVAQPPAGAPAPHAPAVKPKVSYLDNKQLARLMKCVQGDREANVLQAPKLTLANGQASTLAVGDQQNLVIGLKLSWNGETMVCTPQVETVSLGLHLSIQPVVAPERQTVHVKLHGTLTSLDTPEIPRTAVTCEFPAEAKQVGPAQERFRNLSQWIQTPTINKLCVDKVVCVSDGGTALLSGWKKDCTLPTKVGLPVLSKIPYLDAPFTSVRYEQATQYVLMTVTPRIIVNAEGEEKLACPPAAAGSTAAVSEAISTAAAVGKVLASPMENQRFSDRHVLTVGCKCPSTKHKVAKLVEAYRKACSEGRLDEARKLATQAIALDPACLCTGPKEQKNQLEPTCDD